MMADLTEAEEKARSTPSAPEGPDGSDSTSISASMPIIKTRTSRSGSQKNSPHKKVRNPSASFSDPGRPKSSSLLRTPEISESSSDSTASRTLKPKSSPKLSSSTGPLDFVSSSPRAGSLSHLKNRTAAKTGKIEQTLQPFEKDQHEECVQNGIATYYNDAEQKLIYGGKPRLILLCLFDWLLTEAKRVDIYRLVDAFILTYKKYYTSHQLLTVVLSLWDETPPEEEDLKSFQDKRHSSILLFLSEWFELSYASDFTGSTLRALEAWMQKLSKKFRNPLLSKIQNSHKQTALPSICLFEPLKEDSIIMAGKFGFLDLKPRHLADQWTILDMKNFQEITQEEFLLKPEESPHWSRMLKRSHTRWVASEIVQNLNISKRVEVIKRFLQVALRFIENNNFNGLMSLWAGLNMVCVHRLVKTRKKLTKQFEDIWCALETKLSEASNFGQMRKAVEKQIDKGEPVVPWFELINKLRNWTEQVYDDFYSTPEGPRVLVNFNKMYRLGELILAFRKNQKINSVVQLDYDPGKTVVVFKNFLEHLPTYDDEVLWKFSQQCEPETSTPPAKKESSIFSLTTG